jgi:hypothetical protein
MSLPELLPVVQQLPATDKLKLIRILAEQLEATEEILPLEPGKTYQLLTPYGTYGAGGVLFGAMQVSPRDPG